MNALIVEDDEGMSTVLRARFQEIGLHVVVVDTMEAAIAVARCNPGLEVISVDLNLLDTRAPETIPKIRALRDANPDALIVVISGVVTPADFPRLAAMGVDMSFEKLDIPTEKSWWQRFTEGLSGLVNQSTLQTNVKNIQALAARACEKYNAADASLRLPPSAPPVPPSEVAILPKGE